MWFKDIFQTSKRGEHATRAAQTAADDSGLDDLSFLRRLDRLNLRVGRFLRGEAAGQRPSVRRLPASDFREHRLYLPGDDLRHVDWNASARADHVFIKLGEQPKEATVHILLDDSASMNWGAPSKLGAARRLAASLGYLALGHGDRVAVTNLSGPLNNGPRFGPAQGKGQLPALVRYLRGGTRPVGSLRPDRPARADAICQYALSQARGGYVILISDLLGIGAMNVERGRALQARPVAVANRSYDNSLLKFDGRESFRTTLDYFPLPKWQMLVLHLLHPAELHPTARGEIELEDAETSDRANYDLTPAVLEQYAAHTQAWCESLEQTCIAETVSYARVLADWPLEQMVLPYLRKRGVVERE